MIHEAVSLRQPPPPRLPINEGSYFKTAASVNGLMEAGTVRWSLLEIIYFQRQLAKDARLSKTVSGGSHTIMPSSKMAEALSSTINRVSSQTEPLTLHSLSSERRRDEDMTPSDMTTDYKVSLVLYLYSDFWYNSLSSTCTCHYLYVSTNVSQSTRSSKLNF
jgi:hypothetical protein